MIKKSLFYSIFLLACFAVNNTLSVGPSPDIFMLVPITGIATIGGFISAPKIGKFLQPNNANLAIIVGSYAIGGAIGFAACFFAGVKLFKLRDHYNNKRLYEKRIQKEKKDLNDLSKNHHIG